MRSTELGIIYNDQLWDAANMWVSEFHLEADSLKPRKRPMSLASPSIITDDDGNVRMVIGAAGGKYITTALSQVNIYSILHDGDKIWMFRGGALRVSKLLFLRRQKKNTYLQANE